MESQSAGKHTVAKAYLRYVMGAGATHARDTRYAIGPRVKVALRVADDGGLSGGSARCVNSDKAVLVNRKQTEGIVISHVLLGNEGELCKIGK